jgi:uncharacterized protein YxeA
MMSRILIFILVLLFCITLYLFLYYYTTNRNHYYSNNNYSNNNYSNNHLDYNYPTNNFNKNSNKELDVNLDVNFDVNIDDNLNKDNIKGYENEIMYISDELKDGSYVNQFKEIDYSKMKLTDNQIGFDPQPRCSSEPLPFVDVNVNYLLKEK